MDVCNLYRKAEEKKIQLAPFVHLLLQTIDVIQEKDQHMIFAEPVDLVEVSWTVWC